MAKILIAEDERDIRELINFTLTFAGHEIIQASNGEDAVELAQTVLPDLIMLDVRMPRMTGYEACRAIKQAEGTAHIPVVFLSAKGQDDEVSDAMEAGAMDYITKPFSPQDLSNKVADILQKIGVQ